jgi:hypothetical protein
MLSGLTGRHALTGCHARVRVGALTLAVQASPTSARVVVEVAPKRCVNTMPKRDVGVC